MLSTFLTADPTFATTTLSLGGSLLADLFPFVQPIIAVGLVIVVIVGFVKIFHK